MRSSSALGSKEFEVRLREDRDRINRRIDELLPGVNEPPSSLHDAMRYSVLGGGKRLRGILCLAAHDLFGNPYPDGALDAACAIECLHAYTLIHDDLPAFDDDDVRRGKPSCHVAFGEAKAVLAGDALQAMAFEVLSGSRAPGDYVLAAVRILSRAAGSLFLVGGQAADLEGEGLEPTKEKVLFIHMHKTAELISASLSVGAALAGCSDAKRQEIKYIGLDAGLAFQIVDDLLDVEGSEDIVGKGLRKDKKRGKITYPASFGVDRSRRKACELIGSAVGRVKELGDQGYLQRLFELILERVS